MRTDDNFQNVSWEEIQKFIDDNDSYKGFFEQIPISIYRIALDKKDRHKVLNAIMKVLHENDPTNVSEEYAQIIADKMQKLAMEILSRKNKK